MSSKNKVSSDGCKPPQAQHAVCIPVPVQSHIKALLKFAKLLHHKGFYITFVNTEFNHKRFLKNLSDNSSKEQYSSSSDNRFRYETIPDGLSPSDPDSTQDLSSLCESVRKNLSAPFLQLLKKLDDGNHDQHHFPSVSCIVADGFLTFAVESASQMLRIPLVKFYSIAACSLMGFMQYRALLERGLVPLKDNSYLTSGFLDTVVDWIPGMKGIRLKDLPSICWTTDSNDTMFNFCMEAVERSSNASAIVIHTFDALERHVLDALSSALPNLYAIGPLQLLINQLPENPIKTIQYNLWKEETECLNWLNTQKPNSVIYVNFGSIVVMSPQQIGEFAWGLANSNHPFLCVIRPDLARGDEETSLSHEFVAETKERSLISSWCPQEDVLNHPSLGGFVTHCGWNSIMESLSCGVPMLCYPGFGDQQTNCRFACNEWGVGLEIDNDVKRGQVEKLVRELIEGEKGKEMKRKAMEWKRLAEEATGLHGSSSTNLDNLVSQLVLLQKES